METTERIAWQEATYAGWRGTVDGVPMFSISWGTKRDDPKPWKVRSDLPGFKRDLAAETPEGAKALCERMLVRFVTRVGAAFPEDGAR